MIETGPADFFRLGSWAARCDQCYKKCHAEETYLRWDNARVCWQCFELRNPQDFARGIPDRPTPPWQRPTPPPIFLSGSGSSPSSSGGEGLLIGGNLVGAPLLG